MTRRIADFALLSDTESAALVGRDGSIDWLTFPRFDSPACFARLLGDPDQNGRWLLAPEEPVRSVERRYLEESLVLSTRFTTDGGEVEVIDCMPIRSDSRLDVVRLVRGVRGTVAMKMHLVVRFDYGSIAPLVIDDHLGLHYVAGPDALLLATPATVHHNGVATTVEFTVTEGEEVPFDLAWRPSHEPSPEPIDVVESIDATVGWWKDWLQHCVPCPPYDEPVRRSLAVLKGLTYGPTGGIIAAPTTSLPESIGGTRNWDYRYCWLRDATFTLTSFLDAGFTAEAVAWRDWLMRAIAGRPEDAQIMYGAAGERRLAESELPWLPGFEGSGPVRVGNGAHDQFQLDVYGEVLDTFYEGRKAMLHDKPAALRVIRSMVNVVVDRWQEPDDGIWEVRGGRRHFTHSKLMAWVALDRALRMTDLFTESNAPIEKWAELRDEIRHEILRRGVDDRGVFVQELDGRALDASLLLVPLVGFLPASDPRVVATVAAIREELGHDGFIYRYDTDVTDDGVGGDEGTFLLCTFWLVDVLILMGELDEAREIFDRLLGLCNDVGLLAEMYDPATGLMLGNFPQAFSHTAVVTTAMALARADQRETSWHRGSPHTAPTP